MDSLANRDFSVDIGKYLTPISGPLPSGESLRYDPVYDQIRESRREDDPVLDRGVWKMNLKKADWASAEKLCSETLCNRSKDLQVAAWLAEAWLRQYGLAGLREGMNLLNGLSEEFWDTIHPLPEEGDIEYRIAPFEWVNEKLPVLVRLLPVTNPTSDNFQSYSFADWENACRPRTQTQGSRPPEDDGQPQGLTLEKFHESARQTSTPDLTALLELADSASMALSKLNDTLDDKCGSHSPGLGQLSSILSSIRGMLQGFLNERPKPAVARSEPLHSDSSAHSGAVVEMGEGSASGPIRSRADAYRHLAEAADFLVRTEPHSPVPYLVKRAIAWGNMRLEDLLPELVRNSSELSEIYRLLQIGNIE